MSASAVGKRSSSAPAARSSASDSSGMRPAPPGRAGASADARSSGCVASSWPSAVSVKSMSKQLTPAGRAADGFVGWQLGGSRWASLKHGMPSPVQRSCCSAGAGNTAAKPGARLL